MLAPSGGSGSSTLAVNLATALAKTHKSCLLFDLNLGRRRPGGSARLKPAHTLADLCRNSTRMDQAIFERSLVRHSSGVSLLSPSRSFADIGQVTAQGVNDALTLARSLFPYVVCDLDDSFHSEQTQTLRQSDVILLVLRLDFTSLAKHAADSRPLDAATNPSGSRPHRRQSLRSTEGAPGLQGRGSPGDENRALHSRRPQDDQSGEQQWRSGDSGRSFGQGLQERSTTGGQHQRAPQGNLTS